MPAGGRGVFEETVPWYDAIYEWKDYARESRSLLRLLRRVQRPLGRRLLDVACGTGRHVERLRPSFERVVGVDVSPRMLAVARRRNPGVRFVRGDMRDFDLGETFDVVLCLFSSVGYMRGAGPLRAAVRTMSRHLAPGGVLAVEPWFSPSQWKAGGVHMNVVDRPDLKVCRMNVSGRRGRVSTMDMHVLVGTGRRVRHLVERHRMWLFTPAEYRRAFESAGLRASFHLPGPMGRGLWVGRAR
jgi:SAM-dependent methyltransferase